MWVVSALLAALFAYAVSILAKVGIENVNSNLATAVRTFVVLILAWSIVFITGNPNEITQITQKNWIFLILSGMATGASWLFYYKALQLGEVSKVMPIDKFSVVIGMILAFAFLGEAANLKTNLGGILITLGTIFIIL
jgi:transporter family protein